MSGRRRPPGPSDLTDRLRQHLDVIGLTYTLEHLDEHLAWATQEKPAADALLDHVLGAEAAYKLERRIQRRIDQSGLPERKTLEAFDFPFQPKLDKALVFSSNIKLSAWGKYLGDATPPSPSSTASPCAPSASTSTDPAIVSRSPATARNSEAPHFQTTPSSRSQGPSDLLRRRGSTGYRRLADCDAR